MKEFNDHKKQAVMNVLIEQGKVLFSKYGFQKTSISEITKASGIAQGTFYNFFQSKEALYFVILELEEAKMKEQLFNTDIFKENEPKTAIKQILKTIIKTAEINPFIRELYFGDNLKRMMRKLPPESLERHFQNDAASLLPLIEQWKKKGVVLRESHEMIAGMLRSLFILTFHEKEIGESVYDDIMERFINMIVDNLVI